MMERMFWVPSGTGRTIGWAALRMGITRAMLPTNVSRQLVGWSHGLKDYIGREFRWALTSNVVYSMCQWGFVVVLAKCGTPGDVGVYSLGLAITAPILMFANFQGRNLVASDVRDEYSFGEHLSSRIVSLLIAQLMLSGVIALTQRSWIAAAVIFLVGLGQCFDYVS